MGGEADPAAVGGDVAVRAEIEDAGRGHHRAVTDPAQRVPVGIFDPLEGAVPAVQGFAAIDRPSAGHLVPVADVLAAENGLKAVRILLARLLELAAPAM